MQQLSDYEEKSLQKLGQSITEGCWSNPALVQLIELAGGFLNLMSISDYAKKHNMQYQGAKKDTRNRTNIVIFNTKYIIDNE
jgi:hypothetical protein